MKLAFVLLALFVAACHADTNTPVIGVLTIPSNVPGYAAGNYSMIPASYLKHIESAGARVLPIPYDASPENLTFLLNQVNGVLFIGGAPNLTEIDPATGAIRTTNLTDAGTFIFNHILEANARGEHVPITGTCLGHELLAIAISQDPNILWGNFSNINLPGRVKFASDISQSKIWSTIPQDLKDYVSETDGLYFNHNFGLSPSAFHANKRMSQLMKITTTSNPIKGGPEFVASAEGLNFPIFMNQYHPEKPAFEWKKNVNAPHSVEAIEIAQHMINFFVNEARKNDRKFVSDKTLEDSLIYNWVPQRKSQSFEQVYFFRTVVQDTTVWPGLFNQH